MRICIGLRLLVTEGTHTLTVKKANALLMSYVFLCACEACLAYMNVDMYVAAYMMQQACKLLAGTGLLLLL